MTEQHPQSAAEYPNRDTSVARRYHKGTSHSRQSVYYDRHYMDWDNQPRHFKLYPSLEPEKLPSELASSSLPALESMARPPALCRSVPNRQDLAALLYYAGGVTKVGVVPGGTMSFRAAACTGALYHIELYLVCGDLAELTAGVYHFGAHDFALRRIREGDYRGVLVEAAGNEPSLAEAPAILVTTSVYWRNAWKYQACAYRHAYWDSGTILANLLAMGEAQGMPLKIMAAFVDNSVNQLLGLDDRKEAALQLVSVGTSTENPAPGPPELAPLTLETTPYSGEEVEYPAIAEMHRASSLFSSEEVKELRRDPLALKKSPAPQGQLFPLDCLPNADLPGDTIDTVIIRRGSSRRFRRAPISYGQLSTILDRATRGVTADFLIGPEPTLNRLYLIANDVDGLPQGSYVFHRNRAELEQLQAGDLRDRAGYLDLGQELAADASVNVYFLTDLEAVLDRYGNRGYRYAQTEAAIMGGRMYLGAYALKLGATGLTFFDDDVIDFFSPHAEGMSVMFLVAMGRPLLRRQER